MDIFKLGDKILALLEIVFGFWNNQISLVFAMLGQSPVNFKGGGPWAAIEAVNPVFVANGVTIMKAFFATIGNLVNTLTAGSGTVLSINSTQAEIIRNLDFGEGLVMLILAVLLSVIILICGFFMVYNVYFRFLKLLVIVPIGSIAFATMGGNREVSHTAVMYCKYFLSVCFEAVTMALAIVVCNAFINAGLPAFTGNYADWAQTLIYLCEMTFTVALTTGSVKGAQNLTSRALGLYEEIELVIELNKDIERYKESVVMGLNGKQLVCSLVSVAVGGGIVLFLYPYIGLTMSVYVAVPAVSPIALEGFYTFNGMGFSEMMKRKFQMLFANKPLLYVSTEGEEVIRQCRQEEAAEKRKIEKKQKRLNKRKKGF